ncbi:Stealth protein CR4, conserved region 4 [Nocardiopsis flavescens]|uniref:Stealth protein CR4, conserved region 4 n=1 Tax=Nocardiopsis flavescens TaxID=758803 RepID=A0A1M6S2Q1_9ACTN|nr:stealth family protein [Nocardiopsis flavescens]SHK38956.1 Stealth protein CR4, conserved region 4 [Nocardiopsis flavescens]
MALPTRVKRASERLLPASTRARLEAERDAARAAEAERRRAEKAARRRRDLLAADPDLRGGDADGTGLLGRTVTSFTARGASDRNLDLVTAALDRAGIDRFLVRGRSPLRHVVGVHRSDRKRLLDAMRELYGTSALYAVKPGPGGSVAAADAYIDGALDERVKSGLVIRFAERLLSPTGRELAGFEYGCDVEFWREGAGLLEREDFESVRAQLRAQAPDGVLADAWVAPRRNRVSDVLPAAARVPATVTVAGRAHPTFEPFAWTPADEVAFPVDAVYTWVDGGDPAHAAGRARHRDGRDDTLAAGESRFTSRDELRHSLRSLEMYAPWVRHVYLVTDAQVPAWLDTSAPGITVVDHRDILPATALPAFNSHAIETGLHRIEGLSEHYLYFNDDVFLARPVGAERFFHAGGVARLPFSPHQFGVGEPVAAEPAPNSAGKNVRELLAADFGRHITHKFKHVPHPQVRSVMRELEERYGEAVDRTAHSRFRSPADVAVATALHHHYALFTGRGVPGEYAMRYIDIGRPDAADKVAALEADPAAEFFCLNDVDTPPGGREEAAALVRRVLADRFPFPSRFEKDDA